MVLDSDQAKRGAPPVLLDDERPASPLQKRPANSPRQTGNLIPPPVNHLATSVPPSSPSSASSASSPRRRGSTGRPAEVIDLCDSDTEDESDDEEARSSPGNGGAPRVTGANAVEEGRGAPITSTTLAARLGTSGPASAPVKAEQQADDDETEDEMELDCGPTGAVATAELGTVPSGSRVAASHAPTTVAAGGPTAPNVRVVPQEGFPSLRVELPITAGTSSGTGGSAAALRASPSPDGPQPREHAAELYDDDVSLALASDDHHDDTDRGSRPPAAATSAAPTDSGAAAQAEEQGPPVTPAEMAVASSPSSTSTASSINPQEHELSSILEKVQEHMLSNRLQPRRSPSKQPQQPSTAEAPIRGRGGQAGASRGDDTQAQAGGDWRPADEANMKGLSSGSTSGRSTPDLPLASCLPTDKPSAPYHSPPGTDSRQQAPQKRRKSLLTDSLGRLGATTGTGDTPTPQGKRKAMEGGGGEGPSRPPEQQSTAAKAKPHLRPSGPAGGAAAGGPSSSSKPLQRPLQQSGSSPQRLAKAQRDLAIHLVLPHQPAAQPSSLAPSGLFSGLSTTQQAFRGAENTGPMPKGDSKPLPKPALPQPEGGGTSQVGRAPGAVESGRSNGPLIPPVVATRYQYLKEHLNDLHVKLERERPSMRDLPLVFAMLHTLFKTAVEVEGSVASLDLVNTSVSTAFEHLRASMDEEPRKAEEDRRRSTEQIVAKAKERGFRGYQMSNAWSRVQKLRGQLTTYLNSTSGEDLIRAELEQAKQSMTDTNKAVTEARVLYDMAPSDLKWTFREGLEKAEKEAEKCRAALSTVQKRSQSLSFLRDVAVFATHLDRPQGRGGQRPALQSDLVLVWDMWDSLRGALLARAEVPPSRLLLLYDMRCAEHKVDIPHEPPHFECPERLNLAKAALDQLAQRHPHLYTLQARLSALCPYYPLYDPQLKTYRPEVLRVHREHYLERTRGLCDSLWREPDRVVSLSKVDGQRDTMGCSKSFEAASIAFAATLEAVDAVMTRQAHAAFVACRPPGHHAGRCGEPEDDETLGLGFCLLNYAAAAAKHAKSHWHCARVSVIDIDLHHGNGTEEILCSHHDQSYQFISIHADNMFPHTGAKDPTRAPFVVNLPIPGIVDSNSFRRRWSDVEKAVAEFRPDFIILSAGFDAHKNDPIRDHVNNQWVQRGNLTAADYFEVGRKLRDLAARVCLGRVVGIMEGGYSVGCHGMMGHSDGEVGGEEENLGHCVSALVLGMGGQT